MITGKICFTDSDPSLNIFLNPSDQGDLICHPVYASGFSGAYYLHPGLPVVAEDRFYLDEDRDIVVLMSGSVYNRSELAGQTDAAAASERPSSDC